MARQFTADDIVRLLLNVERSVVREALTDERLSAHEIWLEKGVILEEIRKITGTTAEHPDFIDILSNVVQTAIGAALLLKKKATGPIIGRLFRTALDGLIFILQRIWDTLQNIATLVPEAPRVDEFDLTPLATPTTPIPLDKTLLVNAIQALARLENHIKSARTQVIDLFSSIDPVFALVQGPIMGNLTSINSERAQAIREIENFIRSN